MRSNSESLLDKKKSEIVGNKCLYVIMIFINLLLGILGLGILILTIISWVKIKQPDSLIVMMFSLSIFIVLITLIGFFCAKTSSTFLSLYIFVLFLNTLWILIAGIIILVDGTNIIQRILDNLSDSKEIKDEIENFLKQNLKIVSIVFMSIGGVFVNIA